MINLYFTYSSYATIMSLRDLWCVSNLHIACTLLPEQMSIGMPLLFP